MPRGGGGHHGGGHAGAHHGGPRHAAHHGNALLRGGGGGVGVGDDIPPEMQRVFFVITLAKFIGACVLFDKYGIPNQSNQHHDLDYFFNVILFALPACVPFFSAAYMLVCMGLDNVETSLALEVGACFLIADLCNFAIPCCCQTCLFRFTTTTKSSAEHDAEEVSFMKEDLEGAVAAFEASYQGGPSSSLVGVI